MTQARADRTRITDEFEVPPHPSAHRRTALTRLRHRMEYAAAWTAHQVIGALPYDRAARGCGRLMAWLGPRLGAHRRALDTLALVWPDRPAAEREKIARGVWDNLGQVAADLAHLRALEEEPARVRVEGTDVLDRIAADSKGAIFVSAHLACWEAIRVAARRQGINPSMVYRAFNNPLVDAHTWRVLSGTGGGLFHKGHAGARGIFRHLRGGGSVLMLVDQRLNTGVEIDFFGRPVRAPGAAAELSLRLGIPMVPVRAIRLAPGHFRVCVEPPLTLAPGLDPRDPHAPAALVQQVHRRFEAWIAEHPDQWFWLHRRWTGNVLSSPGAPREGGSAAPATD
ncbi:lysophospholipid acyltransferase family protein [Futiania mangrovi]|uniref:Lipid A biosynthesis lauroyl acyltransferase n=1 Tax=Futiania mangrovi TaxID=2959716 RepID=A0A9J6PGT1_9PROT|nr:lauroyl acyltransferase [Futiania mangrovii]MCP1337953.1 hypothetical protein [Futiania mangrovii]